MEGALAHEAESPTSIADAAAARVREPLAIGAPCPNCQTPIAGRWCHACGQSGEDFHRSVIKLGAEAFEGLIDIDGRLWRTLPDLCLRPARLTRRYLDGQRAPQIPPFRLFLMVIVLVFLVAGLKPHDKTTINLNGQGAQVKTDTTVFNIVPVGGNAAANWVTSRMNLAAKNPDAFVGSLSAWAQRLAVLTLPMSAALLGLMFFWRRGVFMFDHLIFSMHSLSFQGLLFCATMLGSILSDWFGWLLLAAPVHLFTHLRGVYAVGVFGTLWRMTVLFAGALAILLMALSGLVIIGLAEVSG